MTRSETEQYKFKHVKLTYLAKTGDRYIQHGMITNTTIKKAIFLLNDTEDDNEVPILYENIEEIKPIKIK
jgi:hypothetical protein